MTQPPSDFLRFHHQPALGEATLVLAFSGWMDGGDVSTGTVRRLVDLLEARPIAEIDPEPFYIYNSPGSMEVAALFRPRIEIADGLIKSIEMPAAAFYCHEPASLVLFVGKEPNLRWNTFADCVLELARVAAVRQILFVGSFGGSVPHTREPRLHVTCSASDMLPEMERYALRRTAYEGPGSFASYLLTRVPSAGLRMASLAAEIPGYLQGPNPVCIEAVTRRLAKILRLPLDLAPLRAASTEWELAVSAAIEKDEEMIQQVRQMEEAYDNELLQLGEGA
ncbi:MAG TPA: PAC2 family protein [Gemmataceae bacterium]|jgi:proteasome assembly chaperone (PAC2) family protein